MDQVSRPLQLVLLLSVAFAALWFVALRPKPEEGAKPSASQASQSQKKSAVPGSLGRAVDKARATKSQGDAAAATRSDRVDAAADAPRVTQNAPAAPVVKPPKKPAAGAGQSFAGRLPHGPNGAVNAGAVALGMAGAAFAGALADTPRVASGPAGVRPARVGSRPRFGTPGKVRRALAHGRAVVLLFYSTRSADDLAVRGELGAVNSRRGRVRVWAVSIRGVARFKNVLRDVQVLQSPTTVVLHRGDRPMVFPGYTDHAEIDQATAVALSAR